MILICAKEDDVHATRVAAVLRERHAQEVFIFDTSTFPSSVALTGRFGNGATSLGLLTREGRRILLEDITSFWWRRPQPLEIDPRITDPQARGFAFQECISALYGMLECCEALWVNDIQNDVAADYKPFQLRVATELGFSIPETLITNEPSALIEFRQRHNGNVIYKAFNQRALAWRPTRLLREEDLAMIDNVRYAPVVFQSLVPGVRDIRVTVIGERIITAEFDIEQMNEIDYRMKMMEIPCRPHQLPADLEAGIRAFMSTLGLEYGGIDFRLTSDNRYVFFEINTAGEFVFLEDRTGQPISEAMAAHLASGKSSNPPRKRHAQEEKVHQ